FVVVDGPMTGQVFSLEGGRKSIGRGPMNDLDIADPQISQRHCLLKSPTGQFAILDLGSLNGTFVNEVKVEGATLLKDGDEVRLGTTKFMFCTDEAAPQQPTPPPA